MFIDSTDEEPSFVPRPLTLHRQKLGDIYQRPTPQEPEKVPEDDDVPKYDISKYLSLEELEPKQTKETKEQEEDYKEEATPINILSYFSDDNTLNVDEELIINESRETEVFSVPDVDYKEEEENREEGRDDTDDSDLTDAELEPHEKEKLKEKGRKRIT